MQSEVIEVLTKGLIKHDLDRIKQAVKDNDEKGLDFIRFILDDYYSGFATTDLIDEFQERGLELVAQERMDIKLND
jgi:hypothetical protein